MFLIKFFGLYVTGRFVNGAGLYLTTRQSGFERDDKEVLYTSGLCLMLPFCEFTIETEDSE